MNFIAVIVTLLCSLSYFLKAYPLSLAERNEITAKMKECAMKSATFEQYKACLISSASIVPEGILNTLNAEVFDKIVN